MVISFLENTKKLGLRERRCYMKLQDIKEEIEKLKKYVEILETTDKFLDT